MNDTHQPNLISLEIESDQRYVLAYALRTTEDFLSREIEMLSDRESRDPCISTIRVDLIAKYRRRLQENRDLMTTLDIR